MFSEQKEMELHYRSQYHNMYRNIGGNVGAEFEVQLMLMCKAPNINRISDDYQLEKIEDVLEVASMPCTVTAF